MIVERFRALRDRLAAPFPAGFDRTYFSRRSWSERVEVWRRDRADVGFASGNVEVVRELLTSPETGVRAVVNITADALIGFLRDDVYRNIYEVPVIGDTRPVASPERRRVDGLFGLGPSTRFCALALGGTGVRFYGEYCMVLKPERMAEEPAARLLDRDSYDVLNEPLSDIELGPDRLEVLRGEWGRDEIAMATMRIVPELRHESRLATSGTISETLLRDQEYIEIHLEGTFGRRDIEEVRQSPDDAAYEAAIAERRDAGLHVTTAEERWLAKREQVRDALARHGIPQRIVTLHGRGNQWK